VYLIHYMYGTSITVSIIPFRGRKRSGLRFLVVFDTIVLSIHLVGVLGTIMTHVMCHDFSSVTGSN